MPIVGRRTAIATGYGIIPFPPLPAWVLLPFVAIWHVATNQQLLATFFAAVDVGIAYWMLGYLPIRPGVRVLTRSSSASAPSCGTPPPSARPGSGPTSWPSAACCSSVGLALRRTGRRASRSRSSERRRLRSGGLELAGRLVGRSLLVAARRPGASCFLRPGRRGHLGGRSGAVGLVLGLVAAVARRGRGRPAGGPGAVRARRSLSSSACRPPARRARARPAVAVLVDVVLVVLAVAGVVAQPRRAASRSIARLGRSRGRPVEPRVAPGRGRHPLRAGRDGPAHDPVRLPVPDPRRRRRHLAAAGHARRRRRGGPAGGAARRHLRDQRPSVQPGLRLPLPVRAAPYGSVFNYNPAWSITDIRYIPQNLGIMLFQGPRDPAQLRQHLSGRTAARHCCVTGAARGLFDPNCPLAMPERDRHEHPADEPGLPSGAAGLAAAPAPRISTG